MTGENRQAPNAWRVLAVLFLVNLLNFFDRAVPVVVVEPIRMEWGLTDLQLGMVAAAFTLTFALAGIPFGRLADTRSRKTIMGWGLFTWSAFTGMAAVAWSFPSFLLTRVGVGIGEATYFPAASSLIGDLFPANKRSRAMGIFMLGLPTGLLLAFFSTGAMVSLFGSWRAPFIIAAIPGLALTILLFMIREPARGAAEAVRPASGIAADPIRSVLRIRSMRWLMIAGIACNFAAYATNTFMVSLIQRYFGLALETAAVSTGVIVGVTGLIGLTFGGQLADRLHRRSPNARLVMAGACLAVSAATTWFALGLGRDGVGLFVAAFSFGWLMQYAFFVCVYPAIHDIVEPRLRGTAMAIFIATINLVGGALGPLLVGFLSDQSVSAAVMQPDATATAAELRAIGLRDAMRVIPVSLLVSAVAIFLAVRTFPTDARAMTARLAAGCP